MPAVAGLRDYRALFEALQDGPDIELSVEGAEELAQRFAAGSTIDQGAQPGAGPRVVRRRHRYPNVVALLPQRDHREEHEHRVDMRPEQDHALALSQRLIEVLNALDVNKLGQVGVAQHGRQHDRQAVELLVLEIATGHALDLARASLVPEHLLQVVADGGPVVPTQEVLQPPAQPAERAQEFEGDARVQHVRDVADVEELGLAHDVERLPPLQRVTNAAGRWVSRPILRARPGWPASVKSVSETVSITFPL